MLSFQRLSSLGMFGSVKDGQPDPLVKLEQTSFSRFSY